MFDNRVSRFYPGSNSATDDGIFSDLYVQERIQKVHEYSNDFDAFAAGDWTQQLNAGSIGLIAGDGGILSIVTAVSAITSQEKLPADFQLAKGFRAWYSTLLQIDNVLGLVIAGLLNATATPFTAGSQTDGVFFLTDNTGALSIVVAVGGTKVTTAMGTTLVPGAVPNAKLSWYYDGATYSSAPNGRIVWEAKGAGVTNVVRGSVPIPSAGTISAFPGAVNIGPVIGASASTAAVRTLNVDFIWAVKDRNNINASTQF